MGDAANAEKLAFKARSLHIIERGWSGNAALLLLKEKEVFSQ